MNKMTFLVGSHMYGLNTNKSDEDFTSLVFDRKDYVRMFNTIPDVVESHDNNIKQYSLKHLAFLQAKGNPNLVELGHLTPYSISGSGTFFISDFLAETRPYLGHQRTAAAYLGHLSSIVKELEHREVTAKRLSHGFRIVYSLEHLLDTGKVCDFRTHPDLKFVREVKENTDFLYHDAMYKIFISEEARIEEKYDREVKALPGNETLKTVINDFFERIYG